MLDESDELDDVDDVIEHYIEQIEHNDQVEIIEHFISLCLNDNDRRNSLIYLYQKLKDNVKR